MKAIIKDKDKASFLIFLIVVFIEQALVATQGVSMYDEGAFLTSYEWFFSYPQCAEYFFMYYNALVAGSIWEFLFGHFHYYGFRIANILVIIATISVCFLILKQTIKHWIFYLGITMHLLASSYGVIILHHNWISALLIVLSIYFILKALNEQPSHTHNTYIYIIIAGIIIGINVFTRVANIALIGLNLILLPYYYYNRNLKITLKLLVCSIIGTFIGIALILLFMMAMGHLDLFVDNIYNLYFMASDEGNGHNILYLLRIYVYNYYKVFRMIIFWYPYNHILMLYAFSIVAAIIAFYKYRSNKQLIYILTAALLMAHLHPIGSLVGILQLGDNSLWLLIPCSIQILVTFIGSLPKYKKIGYVLLVGFSTVYLSIQIKELSHSCDFDYGSRFDKVYRINSKKINVYTQKTYQKELNVLIQELNKYVKPGEVLFCWDNLPLINYITSTRPFLHSAWSSCIPESNIHNAYTIAEEENSKMPVIVISKGLPHDFTTYDPNWNNTHAIETIDHRNKKIEEMLSFIKRHNYHIAWQNELFQILTTK